MTPQQRLVTNVAPSTFSIDMAGFADQLGPYDLFLTMWVTAADVAAGFLSVSMTHVNAAGLSEVSAVISGNLNLADADSTVTTPIEVIMRNSPTAPWAIDFVLTGLAGSALVSYCIGKGVVPVDLVQPW